MNVVMIANIEIKSILGLAALILTVLNGYILFHQYLRDKPKLVVKPVHPEAYQWWFRLPDGMYESKKTRVFGFLAYVSIANKGMRNVCVNEWRLIIRFNNKNTEEIKPMNIDYPIVQLGDSEYGKHYSVLGQKTQYSDGETYVVSGACVGGMAYFRIELFGDDSFDPIIINNQITAYFKIKDVFGKKAFTKITFSEKPLDEIKKICKDIDKIY